MHFAFTPLYTKTKRHAPAGANPSVPSSMAAPSCGRSHGKSLLLLLLDDDALNLSGRDVEMARWGF